MSKPVPVKVIPLADRRAVNMAGLGVCPGCGRGVGTMGFWTGPKYGEGVTQCDGCTLGWPLPVSVGEGEALRLMTRRVRG